MPTRAFVGGIEVPMDCFDKVMGGSFTKLAACLDKF